MQKLLIMMCALSTGLLQATTYYVDAARPNDGGAGTSWTAAKQTIQSAIALATTNGDKISVTNGIYAPISATNNQSIAIESVNGAAVTIIDGGGTSRCAILGRANTHTNTVLTGFTLRNGNADGVDVVLSRGNGGGSFYGTLKNCTLSGNTATYGGGSFYGTLKNCTLSGNSASWYGGGSYDATLNNCTLSGNTAIYGGGSLYGTLNNCTLSGNTATYGGGSYDGTLNTCTLIGNSASMQGGGSCDATLNNCTLSGNTASGPGGGSSWGTLNNCIVWGNTAPDGANYAGGIFSGSCTIPLPSGTGNIAADPLFVNAGTTNLRLQDSSPCINTGLNGYAPAGTDLDGNPRIVGGTVDMGAYEYIVPQVELVITSPGAKTYGDMAFQLETTGGSGTGAVTYSLVSGSGTVSSSGLVTITGAGSIMVQATKAADANYNSVTSANLTITVNKADQSALVITSPGAKTYGDAAFQLATTGGSGTGAVTYAWVSGPGTVSSSGLVTITGVGSIVAQATQAADDNYSSVTSGSLTITVNKATQALLIITSPGAKTYGEAAFQLATSGGSSTGTVSYVLISGPGTVSSSGLVTITGVGSIVVQATKAADANYNSATSANLTITVNKADQATLVITSPGAKTYGDAAFQLSTTGGSGTGTVTHAWVSGPGTVSSSGLVTITGAGDIVVQATKAGDANYNSVTSANLTITVNKALQTGFMITSGDRGKVGHSYTIATTGGIGTSDISYEIISGPGVVDSFGVITFSSTGTVAVLVVKAGDANYLVAEARKTITVDVREVTVTFDPQGGEVVPAESVAMVFEATYTNLPAASRSGYTFCGWYDTWTNNAILVTNEMPLLVQTDHSLYAKWIAGNGRVSATNGLSIVVSSDGKSVTVKSLPSVSGAVVIPDRIPNTTNGLPVTEIAPYAFYNRKLITDVKLGIFVTNIADFGFAYCSSLTNVTLQRPIDMQTGNYVDLTIGKAAFALCESLRGVAIPAGTIQIGQLAFAQCFALTEIRMGGATAPVIAADAFTGTPKTGVLTVRIPSGATGYTGGAWAGVTVVRDPIIFSMSIRTLVQDAGSGTSGGSFRTMSVTPVQRFSLLFSVVGGSGVTPEQAARQLLADTPDKVRVNYRGMLTDEPSELIPVALTGNGDGTITVEIEVPGGMSQGFFQVIIKD